MAYLRFTCQYKAEYIWMPSSLYSELTPMIFNTGLTHLDSGDLRLKVIYVNKNEGQIFIIPKVVFDFLFNTYFMQQMF